MDEPHSLSGWMMALLFERGNDGELEDLGRKREGRGRENEFNFGHFELEVPMGYK